jgi:hypothetical protein
MSQDEPTTQELKAIQVDREEAEREMADEAPTDPETRTHARRADKAAYLKEKLDDQAEALGE